VIELQDRLIKSQRKIDVLSTQDLLTGVLNRASVFERLRQELDRSQRKSLPVGIMIVQANDLKPINEEHGREAGDQLLAELGHRIKRVIRTYDSAGRLKGNQFAIVLPDTNRHQAQKAADRVIQALTSTPICIDGNSINAAIGIGASNTLDVGYDFDVLLSNVDEAIAATKRGEECVQFALHDTFVGPIEIAQLPETA
jgi:diguanylate cyclase (GGDEF)-like protein